LEEKLYRYELIRTNTSR